MTTEERVTTSTTGQAAAPTTGQPAGPTTATTATTTSTSTTSGPSRDETARRIVIFGFGIVQAILILRIVLLMLDARESNGLVSGILDFSQIFVAPFEGMLRTNALTSGGSVFDVAAVVALIGVTLLEGLVLAAISIFRREPARA